ncbi:hypothetical protein ACA910_004694 [Epithemia clementina (nom. ined.)]
MPSQDHDHQAWKEFVSHVQIPLTNVEWYDGEVSLSATTLSQFLMLLTQTSASSSLQRLVLDNVTLSSNGGERGSPNKDDDNHHNSLGSSKSSSSGLAHLIATCHHLTHLELIGCSFGNDDHDHTDGWQVVEELSNAMRRKNMGSNDDDTGNGTGGCSLQHVVIQGCVLDSLQAALLWQGLAACTQLQSLQWTANHILTTTSMSSLSLSSGGGAPQKKENNTTTTTTSPALLWAMTLFLQQQQKQQQAHSPFCQLHIHDNPTLLQQCTVEQALAFFRVWIPNQQQRQQPHSSHDAVAPAAAADECKWRCLSLLSLRNTGLSDQAADNNSSILASLFQALWEHEQRQLRPREEAKDGSSSFSSFSYSLDLRQNHVTLASPTTTWLSYLPRLHHLRALYLPETMFWTTTTTTATTTTTTTTLSSSSLLSKWQEKTPSHHPQPQPQQPQEAAATMEFLEQDGLLLLYQALECNTSLVTFRPLPPRTTTTTRRGTRRRRPQHSQSDDTNDHNHPVTMILRRNQLLHYVQKQLWTTTTCGAAAAATPTTRSPRLDSKHQDPRSSTTTTTSIRRPRSDTKSNSPCSYSKTTTATREATNPMPLPLDHSAPTDDNNPPTTTTTMATTTSAQRTTTTPTTSRLCSNQDNNHTDTNNTTGIPMALWPHFMSRLSRQYPQLAPCALYSIVRTKATEFSHQVVFVVCGSDRSKG